MAEQVNIYYTISDLIGVFIVISRLFFFMLVLSSYVGFGVEKVCLIKGIS